MPTITTTDGVEIFFKDWGSGQPIVFSHGWPLSSDDWDAQMLFFLQHGYRVIAHDRRGHGRSTQASGRSVARSRRPESASARTCRCTRSTRPPCRVAYSTIRPYWLSSRSFAAPGLRSG